MYFIINFMLLKCGTEGHGVGEGSLTGGRFFNTLSFAKGLDRS